jgi:tRNA (cytidine/uridine-2'-O-)-methyltransferase
MFDIALFEPEIPPNTGNIIRLAANTGSRLHLIGKLGFSMDEKSLRRAGLDYHQYSSITRHADWEQFVSVMASARIFAFSTKGKTGYSEVGYEAGDILLFGPETRGLPTAVLDSAAVDTVLKLPMVPQSRSLNLSNTVAVVVYEAWRQHGYTGALKE